MNDIKPLLEEVLKETLADLREPLLFQNLLRNSEGAYEWKLFEWNFSEFAEKLGDVKLPFRVGYNARIVNPQWEKDCSVKYMTLREFLESVQCRENDEIWYYFDYKYMQEWFKGRPEIITSLNWRKFGINKDGSDSTLWIGSKGAHTNCHQDSYGYNVIAQIHGRKQWLLFPPDSSNSLEPTRIPYEESTIYSKFNFFCPSKKDERKILDIPYNPKLIILEPGDVLFVPWGWWHYVESLDCTMSVNIWLPLKADNKARVKESLVKLIVAKIGDKEYSTAENEDNHDLCCISLIEAALQQCRYETNTVELPCAKKSKHALWTTVDLVKHYPSYIKLLDDVKKQELQKFLEEKRERFSLHHIKELSEKLTDIKALPPHKKILESIVNALCHPEVIDKTTELLLIAHSSMQ